MRPMSQKLCRDQVVRAEVEAKRGKMHVSWDAQLKRIGGKVGSPNRRGEHASQPCQQEREVRRDMQLKWVNWQRQRDALPRRWGLRNDLPP